MKCFSVTIQMTVTERYFGRGGVFFFYVAEDVLTFEPLDHIFQSAICGYSKYLVKINKISLVVYNIFLTPLVIKKS